MDANGWRRTAYTEEYILRVGTRGRPWEERAWGTARDVTERLQFHTSARDAERRERKCDSELLVSGNDEQGPTLSGE